MTGNQQEVEEEDSIAVSFANVDYTHPNGIAALFGINLSIRRGEVIAIMGTNGAGKSTLIRHVNGLLKPTHGQVRTFGVDTKQTTTAILSRKVGIVFQNPDHQLFAQTVRQEIEFALKNFGLAPEVIKERTSWALNSFELLRYSDSPPMELSGGEKKRLCVALVLAWSPEILILDEPTVGQDVEQKEKLAEIIRMLQAQGRTVIIVSHDVEFVWPIQPRIVLMSGGKIIADGTAQQVFGDQDWTDKANVIAPQLVQLGKLLHWGDPMPGDIFEASKRLKLLFLPSGGH